MCDICKDLGSYMLDLPVGHPQFGKLIRCECKAAEDSARLQSISNMTNEERLWRLSDIETQGRSGTTEMVSACIEFLADPSGILTIHGTCGNAKSHALCSMVNGMLEAGNEAVYILAFDLINHIRQAYSQKDNSIADDDAYSRLKKFAAVKFLAIDELDKIFPLSYWEEKQLTQFFDVRYRYGIDETKGTVIAMNRSPFEVLENVYHILSRLKDGRNRIVYNGDSDMRNGIKK